MTVELPLSQQTPPVQSRKSDKPLKARKCVACKTAFTPDMSGQKACGPACALAHVEKEKAIEKKKQELAYRRETRRRKEALKTHKDYFKELDTDFKAYIRARDGLHHLGCVSCRRSEVEVELAHGKKHGGAWDAGHYLGATEYPATRFNEANVHRQCKKCNAGAHKRPLMVKKIRETYRLVLTERIGIEAVEWLESEHKPVELSIEKLKVLRAFYRKLTKEIQRYQESFHVEHGAHNQIGMGV